VSGDANSDIDVLITPIGSCAVHDFEVVLESRYAWFKAGTVSTSGNSSITFSPAAMAPIKLYTTSTLQTSPELVHAYHGSPVGAVSAAGDDSLVHLSLGSGPVGFSTSANPTVAKISALLTTARATEEALLIKTFGADRAGKHTHKHS
jgi:hypothetical protein